MSPDDARPSYDDDGGYLLIYESESVREADDRAGVSVELAISEDGTETRVFCGPLCLTREGARALGRALTAAADYAGWDGIEWVPR